jgi:predicted CXXCH cytochrome family protein
VAGITAAEQSPDVEKEEAQSAAYVGSERCSTCHSSEHRDWLASQHRAAMQEATEKTVLGDFDGGAYSKEGVESRFFKKDGKHWVKTDGPDGKLADFEVRYTFGVAPLQQYLIELSGGRFQAFGLAWDARSKEQGGQRWYDLYPNRSLKAGDPMHWTGIDQNWNFQCAYCHSTNLQKNYDAATGTFQTTWSEISVGCEACHGPASKHVAWATKSGGWEKIDGSSKGFAVRLDERRGVGWPMSTSGQATRSAPRTTNKEIEVCAACHARRQQFSSNSHDFGRVFDSFRPSALERGLYYADGQQRDEVYTYGSFLQSRMHAAGVTCSDCHNPHSGKVRFDGNAVCTQCHAAERFDVTEHHRHSAGSKGAQCQACHMSTTTYMGVDARHDHSMRLPRPDRAITLGAPSACDQCHAGKEASWAKEATAHWYPSPKAGAQTFADAFDLGDREAPGAQAQLSRIALDNASPAIVRASALQRLGRFTGPEVLAAARQSLKADDPMVRVAAVAVIARADPEVRLQMLVPLLRDDARLVRIDAARALAGAAEAGLADEQRSAFESALAEYIEAQNFNAERPEAQANLGGLHRDRGRLDEAAAAFRKAIAIDPTFIAASISLADLVRTQGNEGAAETILRESLARHPGSGPLLHALALSLIRQKRTSEAMPLLAEAAEKSPDEPRFSYVWAVALHDGGMPAKAIAVLRNALARHPYDRDLLWVRTRYEIEANNIATARETAELLSRLEPQNQEVRRLLHALQRRMN